jgi:hypothetical protein
MMTDEELTAIELLMWVFSLGTVAALALLALILVLAVVEIIRGKA